MSGIYCGVARGDADALIVESAVGVSETRIRRCRVPSTGRCRKLRHDACEDEIARDLEQRVPDEEDRCAESIGGGGEAEVAVHLQRRHRDVRAVHRVAQEEHSEEREQPRAHPPHHGSGEARFVARRLVRVSRIHGA